jgi:hypothetical protein
VFCFIDADCGAHPDWLRVAFSTMASAPDRTSVFAYMQTAYIEKHGFFGTSNLVVRRVDFERIGPFEGIQVAEDMD